MCAPMSSTLSSCAGSTPRTITPRLASPTESIAWPTTYGAVAITRGLRRASAATAPASAQLRQTLDLDVRRDREDARAQLLLEAVHHREHDDQRPHAEPDAQRGGHAMNEMNALRRSPCGHACSAGRWPVRTATRGAPRVGAT
jgi:hypothetical protein